MLNAKFSGALYHRARHGKFLTLQYLGGGVSLVVEMCPPSPPSER
jgi:hypothetical protein